MSRLYDICTEYAPFILEGGDNAFEHFVILQSRNKYKARFALGPASGHNDIYLSSTCGRFVPLVYTMDPAYNNFDQWEVIKVIHSRKDYFEFLAQEKERALKEDNGNGMRCFIVESYVKSKNGYDNHDYKLYYLDEKTDLLYEELFNYHTSLKSSDQKICPAYGNETYKGEDGEYYYKQLEGLKGLEEHYKESFGPDNTLSKFFEIAEYRIVELGVL